MQNPFGFARERQEDRSVLEKLAKTFSASIREHLENGTSSRTQNISAPLERNVRATLERADKIRPTKGNEATTAIARALSVTPPASENDHPFVVELAPATHAKEALSRLIVLSDWSDDEQQERNQSLGAATLEKSLGDPLVLERDRLELLRQKTIS